MRIAELRQFCLRQLCIKQHAMRVQILARTVAPMAAALAAAELGLGLPLDLPHQYLVNRLGKALDGFAAQVFNFCTETKQRILGQNLFALGCYVKHDDARISL